MRKIQRDLAREFPLCTIERTGSGHFRIILPNGRTVFAPTTPGDRRALRNVRADVRRALRATNDATAAEHHRNRC
jgi:hypothetical protein